MKWKLKNWPLSRQILILFLLLTTILGTSVGITYPLALQKYLVNNTYSLLEEEFNNLAQNIAFDQEHRLLPVPVPAPYFLQVMLQNYEYSFEMLVFDRQGTILGYHAIEPIPKQVAAELFRAARSEADEGMHRGTLPHRGEDYLYVSQEMHLRDYPYYLVLFSKERELNQINSLLTRQFFVVFAIIVGVSLLVAAWFSRYLTNPLRRLEESCQKIARRQFDIPLRVDREDEIGQLARSFDTMKNQLKEYDESQRYFVQNISHELKTPIMAIQGYTQGLLEGVFQGEQAEKGLEIIMQESKRLEKVVEQLLYLTKIESVAQMIQFTPLNLSELFVFLHQRFSMLNPQIEWQMNVPDTLPVEGDGEQLNTAFVNILENQLRYAKSKLVIDARQMGNTVEIHLANDGPPIEESLLPNLFQRFRKGKTGKHGLGLAIARAVFEVHGGTIEARNEPGGVRFVVRLPVTQQKRERVLMTNPSSS
ncbi:HAMP domain-containing sensor histidine kinase [Brevibacillus dissolubilis]|uniref:HAMP domain-containing sensor histidine kinase n=1 Tax=Brevibacillus dissolubilis TaxID=1844116 RepID=UPI001115D452|nr:HAMP domain-containing sensor histidine kinase [Brevibacillus dissolubilis]